MDYGAGASSYINDIRYTNEVSIEKYTEKINNRIDVKNIEEKQNLKNKISEYIILKLRLIEGINISNINKKFNIDVLSMYAQGINGMKKLGLIEIAEGKYIKLTKKGLDLANIVWEQFI